jgi:hypothetical protein
MHQRRDHMVEHHPGGDPAVMTAPRVVHGELRLLVDPDQGSEPDPQRVDDGSWQQRHGPPVILNFSNP